MTKLYEKMRLAENIKGQRYLRGINRKIELIIKLMEIAKVKIFKVRYSVKEKQEKARGWYEVDGESINVSSHTAERAIEAAKKNVLSISYEADRETGKKIKLVHKDFVLISVDLVAEADIKG
jgi:hypothetical protein